MNRLLKLGAALCALIASTAIAATIPSTIQKPEDGLPLINRASLDQIAGVPLQLTRAEFHTEVTGSVSGTVLTVTSVASGVLSAGQTIYSSSGAAATIASLGTGTGGAGTYNLSTTLTGTTFTAGLLSKERSRIASNSVGVLKAGDRLRVLGEVGERSFTLGTGGSDSANAAASHFRVSSLPGGGSVTVANDANSVGTTTGAPASATGINGDVLVDRAANVYYVKAAGAWAAPQTLMSAGPTPFARTLSKLRTAAQMAAVRNAEEGPLWPGSVTIAVGSAATSALSNLYTMSDSYTPASPSTSYFEVRGAYAYFQSAGNVARYFTMDVGTGGNIGAYFSGDSTRAGWDTRASVTSIRTSADVVEFQMVKVAAGRYPRLLVNDQYYSLTPVDVSAATGSIAYVKLTFPSRELRKISWEFYSNTAGLYRVGMSPLDNLSLPASQEIVSIAYLGDSFSVAQNANINTAWGYVLGRLIGANDVWNYGIGGTGYRAGGTNNILAQIARWPKTDLDAIFFAAGYNDSGQATLAADATAAWTAARLRCPRALIVVLGPWVGKTGPSAQKLADEDVIKAAFDAWNDPLKMYIPVARALPPFQNGTGSIANPTGSGNSDLTTSNDDLHPSDYGQRVLAFRTADAYRLALSSSSLTAAVSLNGVNPPLARLGDVLMPRIAANKALFIKAA